ncbi:MAG: hypothetical protein U0989_05240, partial [Azonexus sp.]|nr:hypothetical protein [Azonexus sp.]
RPPMWLLYADPEVDRLRRSGSGSFTPIIGWLHYGDPGMALLGRSMTPGLGEIGDFLVQSSIAGLGSVLSGGKFGHGFASAGLTRLAAPGLTQIKSDTGRAAASALVGGSISKLTGGKFSNGAVTGAMQSALEGLRSGTADGYGEPDPESITDRVFTNDSWKNAGAVQTEYLGGGRYRLTGEFIFDENSDQALISALESDVKENLNGTFSNESGTRIVEIELSFRPASPGEAANILLLGCGENLCVRNGLQSGGFATLGGRSGRLNEIPFRRNDTGSHELLHMLGMGHSSNSTRGLTSYARNRQLQFNEAYRLAGSYLRNYGD